ncbi:thioredoxin-dependent thiol peroxidase [bacterium]|nr:thioredoxin-dependent thiol peroxidase [bacterium]
MVKAGDRAPDFSLPDQAESTARLGDYRGKWVVLYFYPKDDTPGCTTEACEFTSALDDLAALDAVVLGVSPDSPASHGKFAAKHGLKVRLLSDPEHRVLEQYGAWQEKSNYGKKYMGVQRSTFLIDPQGRVAFDWPKVSVKGHVEEVRAKLAELRG